MTRRWLLMPWLSCFVLCVGAVLDIRVFAEGELGRDQADGAYLECGPRCVQFVLAHYGISVELVPLMREIQWPELERGTSLGCLRDVLRSRGIETALIQADPDAEIVAGSPVILHCENAKGSGHFVVQTEYRGKLVFWDGLRGYREDLPEGFSLTGSAVITSREPLTCSSWQVVRRWSWRRIAVMVGGAAAGGWCIIAVVRRMRIAPHTADVDLHNEVVPGRGDTHGSRV